MIHLQPSPPPSHGRGQWQRGEVLSGTLFLFYICLWVCCPLERCQRPLCHAMTGVSPWGVAKSWFEKSTTPCEKQQLCVPGKVI